MRVLTMAVSNPRTKEPPPMMPDLSIRRPGRPALPADQAQTERRTVRLDAADAALLAKLATALGTSEADALRIAMRAAAARHVR